MTDTPDVDALARDFHETYERIAAGEGWETQKDCRTDFGDLPQANRKTMLAVCQEIHGRHIAALQERIAALESNDDPACDRCGDVCCGCYAEEAELRDQVALLRDHDLHWPEDEACVVCWAAGAIVTLTKERDALLAQYCWTEGDTPPLERAAFLVEIAHGQHGKRISLWYWYCDDRGWQWGTPHEDETGWLVLRYVAPPAQKGE